MSGDPADSEAAARARVREVCADTNLEPLLDLRTLRRVERHDHLET